MFGQSAFLLIILCIATAHLQNNIAFAFKLRNIAKRDDTLATIQKLVGEELEVDPSEVSIGSKFVDDLGADSLGVVELVMSLEEKFGIEIPDEEAEKMQTVNDVYKYISERKD